MSYPKVSFQESIDANVVNTGKCIGCSACVVSCPFNCLEHKEEKPVLVKECKVCGICAQVCPQTDWSRPKAENFVYGRESNPEESFGITRRLILAQAREDKTLKAGQDGGAATALLLFAVQKGLIESAAVSGSDPKKPFYPAPTLASSPEEVLKCAGTKYFYSPNLFAVAQGAQQKKASLAFVGTPCQIRAFRKMQMLGLKKYTSLVKFSLGLLCSECFTYEGLMENHIHGKLGISLADITKMNIKGKMLVTTKSGVAAIPLAEAKQYARKSCRFCDDFSSELADVSLGGLGMDGWTFLIIRTPEGEKLVREAEQAGVLQTKPVGKEDAPLNLLVKLSKKKRESMPK